jgi:hypothetical protein
MIEEMAKVLEFCCTDKNIENCNSDMSCDYCRAKELYNAGYRKIPENAVVLTREEWDKYQTTNRDWNAIYFEGIEKARKETAEKLSDKLHRKMEPYMQPHTLYWQKEKELFKVFLDKFDEIAKEFTEGK